jgi:hypothetical protein
MPYYGDSMTTGSNDLGGGELSGMAATAAASGGNPWILAASVAAPIVTGVLGNFFSQDERSQAEAAFQRALNEISAIGAAPDLARQIILRNFEQVGVLTPELEEAVNLEAPKVSQIKEAPELKKAQMTALQLLGQRATGGMSAEDRANLAQIQLQQARDTEAKRQQIIQSYQQRGLGGAGSELAAQLQAASAGSAQVGEEGLKVAAQAQRAALEAAREYGGLGGQIRGQEFDIARTKAGAEDQAALARFNEAVARQQRNVSTRMGVQQQNLAARQRIAEQNVAQANAELQRQRAAEAQQYQLNLQRAGLMAGAYGQRGAQLQQQAQQEAGQWAQGGAAIGQGLGQYSQYLQNQDKLAFDKKKLAFDKAKYRAQYGKNPWWEEET